VPATNRQRFTLSDGAAEVVIAPSLGAGLESYDLISRGRRERLFRAAPVGTTDPFSLASIPLLPWSNRISGGGFEFGGRFHGLEPNVPGEPFPIHGNGFSSPWRVKERDPVQAVLSLSSDGPGPFRYEAQMSYGLAGGALTMKLTIVNTAPISLPYGFGFHPWLPRTRDVLLAARAEGVWLENQQHLPTDRLKAAERPEWNFSAPRPLPARWINNAFDGWDGQAEVIWPDRRLSLRVEAGPKLGVYIVYSPDSHADFFCFEPVSHPIDAHNLPGLSDGLEILGPGDQLEASCLFIPRDV
jgi:aldose 1-epimerase